VILLQIPERHTAADVVALGLIGSELQLEEISTEVLPVAAAEACALYVSAEEPDAEAGALHTVTLPGAVPATVLIVGLGDASPEDLRVAAVALGRRIERLPESRSVAVAIHAPSRRQSRALAEGLVLGGYQYSKASDAEDALHQLNLVGTLDRAGLDAGDEAADAAGWARDLGNAPPNELTPARMGELAEQQLTPAGCKVSVHDEAWLTAQGFGGVLAVGGGSAAGPRLIEVTYRPRRKSGAARLPHVVLVGKGITFDTGGLNLKLGDGMRTMHTDMCGGAAVLAAVQYAAMRKLAISVTVLVPAAENAVSGTATRPSDVITHFGGRTTEVGNTDAEGRLILADALGYAVKRLKPDVLIDVATLTGAARVALGMEIGAYFANDDALAAQLEQASADSGEPIWRMPLEHHYVKQLESPVADARNDPGTPGAITAALFLQPFVGDVAWAHLDIAGPARAAADGPVLSHGATGFGARLLAHYLDTMAGSDTMAGLGTAAGSPG
jgi:leucyl aminopeptidase